MLTSFFSGGDAPCGGAVVFPEDLASSPWPMPDVGWLAGTCLAPFDARWPVEESEGSS